MFNRKPGKSLEDAIRDVHNRYKNRPSPLQGMQENAGFTPTQVPNNMRAPSNDLRGNLLGAFKPNKDTFR